MSPWLRRLLEEPRARGLPVDGAAFTIAQREILRTKPQTRRVFERAYALALALAAEHGRAREGRRFEIGSGAGFLEELAPDIVTSDVKVLPFVDVACAADALPVAAGSLSAIFAFNVFHHLPSPRRFFREMIRVLAPGGVVVLVEPFHGPLARLIFARLFTTEGFDPQAPAWEAAPGAGPMSLANQALSYVVFRRDRALFEREFPELEIVVEKPHAHLAYLASGGVNFRALAPAWGMGAVLLAERMLAPLDGWLSLQQAIVLRRREES
jgi:SAM-dependent methyltransferase